MRVQSLSSQGRVLALLTVFAFAWSPALYAQDDPFGEFGDDLADAFEEEHPFGGDSGFAEPFGESADPFGGHAIDDASDEEDPFGELGDTGPKRASRRAHPTRRSAGERVARKPGKRAGRTEKLSHQQRLQRLGIYSVDPLEIKEIRILEVLRQDVSYQFDNETLADAIDSIASDLQIPIVFDNEALSEETIDPTSETVSLPPVNNLSLASSLNIMLGDLGLTFLVKNEVLVVTTETAAEEHLVTRVYRRDPNWKLTEDQMTHAIESAVVPNSWEAVGGPGSMAVVKDGLVISNSMHAHNEINKLFAKLDRLYTPKSSGSKSSVTK